MQIPIKSAIAQNFGVFNKLYTAVPSASSPNHLFTQSATSCGMQHNGLYNDCLGPTVMFPQFTIYDNMRLHNVSLDPPSVHANCPPSLHANCPRLIAFRWRPMAIEIYLI